MLSPNLFVKYDHHSIKSILSTLGNKCLFLEWNQHVPKITLPLEWYLEWVTFTAAASNLKLTFNRGKSYQAKGLGTFPKFMLTKLLYSSCQWSNFQGSQGLRSKSPTVGSTFRVPSILRWTWNSHGCAISAKDKHISETVKGTRKHKNLKDQCIRFILFYWQPKHWLFQLI